VAKRNENWVLKYVKSAKAWTDVPDNVPEFISQRRRWLNGSFFAAFYAIYNFFQLFQTSHSILRSFLLMIEFTYSSISMLFNWFSLANFYLTFYFLTSGYSPTRNQNYDPTKDPFHGNGDVVFNVVRELYLLTIIVMFVISLGNRPQGSKWIYIAAIFLFALIMIVMLYSAGFTVYLQMPQTPDDWALVGDKIVSVPTFRNIVISLASTYGLYFLSSFMHLEPWHMFTCFFQYMLLLPAFVNILMVYAFCNTHDVSWGTKGDNATKNDLGHVQISKEGGKEVVDVNVMETQDIDAKYDRVLNELSVRPKAEKKHRDTATKREDYYKGFRTRLVLTWMFTNAALVIVFTSDFMSWLSFRKVGANDDFNPYLTFVFWTVAGMSAFRFMGSLSYLLLRLVFG